MREEGLHLKEGQLRAGDPRLKVGQLRAGDPELKIDPSKEDDL